VESCGICRIAKNQTCPDSFEGMTVPMWSPLFKSDFPWWCLILWHSALRVQTGFTAFPVDPQTLTILSSIILSVQSLSLSLHEDSHNGQNIWESEHVWHFTIINSWMVMLLECEALHPWKSLKVQ
jgi:hypothetical protein